MTWNEFKIQFDDRFDSGETLAAFLIKQGGEVSLEGESLAALGARGSSVENKKAHVTCCSVL